MGGIGQFALSQMSPDQQAALIQQIQPSQTPAQPQPATTGYSSDISNPSAMPSSSSTVIPGSTSDLENRAAQGPQQIGQELQQQRTPQQTPGQFSAGNPFASIAQDYQSQWAAAQPKPTGGGVKGLLSHFFQGMGGSMMAEAGLPSPDIKRQQLQTNMMVAMNHATAWENAQGEQRYRDALTSKLQADADFESQMRPLQLTEAQQAVQRGNEAATTVHPAMTAADLKSLGVPDDLASQYQGKPLTSADFGALKDLSAAGQTRIYDYGADGQGQGKGQWLVDKNYNPIKQLSPVSETGRATALQKQQFAQQNALMKGAQSPVYAYDPAQKATVLTTQAQAQQGGMNSVRGVKESDIRNDTHDTRVLNDVAVKNNNLLDSADALDQNEKQRLLINWALSQGENQLKVGAFGTQLPTGWANSLVNSANMSDATQKTRDYVVNTLSLRESAMGLQKVLTGSARANEAQITALQNTLPGFERDSAMARQKLGAFGQNIDLLRQGIPRMPGIDVVPVKSGTQKAGAAQTTGAAGFNWNNFPVASNPR